MSDTRQFLREFNEYWVREDTAAILDAVTDDIRFEMVGDQGIAGKKEFAAFLEKMQGGGSDMKLDIDKFIIEGERAAVTGRIAMTDAEGERRTYGFCDVYRLAGGKVAELTAYVTEIKPGR